MSKALRVVHVIQSLQVGGLERMVVNLVCAQAALGVESFVIATHEDGPLHEVLEAEGVGVAVLSAGAGISPKLPVELMRTARAFAPHVMHSHHLGPFIYTAPAAALLGARHLHTEHSHEFYDTPRRRMLGRCMHATATVTAVSDEIAAFHARAFGRSPRVVHNGVAVNEVRAHARSEARALLRANDDDVIVGCVARLAPEKRHDRLLRAFATAQTRVPQLRLVLVGDGVNRSAIAAQVQALGLAQRVELLGVRHDVPALLPGFDMTALASEREGLSLALLESLAAAVPIVATDVGESHQLRNGGCVVAQDDEDAFAQALVTFAVDSHTRRSAGVRGQALVRASYSMASMADAYLGLYAAQVVRSAA